MERKEVTRFLSSHAGLTFDKHLIDQQLSQNHANALDLFRRNTLLVPKTINELGSPTLTRLSNPYTDSLISLNPNKTRGELNTFCYKQQIPTVNTSKLSNISLSMNNPYLYNLQQIGYNKQEANSNLFNIPKDSDQKNKFLTLLNDLQTLYIGPSFTDKTNEARIKKLNILIDYFSNLNDENNFRLDDKACLVYKNLTTNTKFALYVDYFVKYPSDLSSKSLPMYFKELFLDKILKSQNKFNPTLHYKPTFFKKKNKKDKKPTQTTYKTYR